MVQRGAGRSPRVVIVGAGMSGLCMGIKLQRAGIDSFTIYEKADAVGGTWRDNTYPGLTCDVPSRFYQYSFAMNPEWTHWYPPGAEIWAYFDRIADDYRLREHIRFGTEVTDARFVDGRWLITTSTGTDEADFLISATGVLHHPRYPDIEGLDTFEGACFHSARWDHDVPLDGKRIGIIGTGSTATQIVTALADRADLRLFQRTAQWIFPAPNRPYTGPTKAVHRRFPRLGKVVYRVQEALMGETVFRAVVQPGWRRRLISAVCRANLRTVRDPELRRKLTPDYQPMCKRLIASSGFYRAMQRPNVQLIIERIERIEPKGVRTADGALHELDVLVLATGFDAHAFVRPMRLTGVDGVQIDDAWSEGPRAYRTVALPGFPNFFMLMGPHSPVGNYSLVAVAEVQARYAMRCIETWRRGEASAMAPTPEATEEFNQRMREAMPNTVWVTGCQSWYLGKDGLPELWPWTPDKHRDMLREPDLTEFELR